MFVVLTVMNEFDVRIYCSGAGSKQNRIAVHVWAPTKPPARNGQFAKTFLANSTLTLACARHDACAAAH